MLQSACSVVLLHWQCLHRDACPQLVLEKQLQDIIRYTNELENREATMCAAASSPLLNALIICPALIVPISFRLLHENKTLKAEIASLQKAE